MYAPFALCLRAAVPPRSSLSHGTLRLTPGICSFASFLRTCPVSNDTGTRSSPTTRRNYLSFMRFATFSTTAAAVSLLLLTGTSAVHAQSIFGGNSSRFDFTSAASVNEGVLTATSQGDAYDGALVSRINGAQYNSGVTVAGQTATGTFVDVNGVSVRNRYLVSTALPVVAQYVDLVNNSASSISFTYESFNNLGSDGIETVYGSSSGDNVVTAADRWSVSDDSALNTVGGDPALSFVYFGTGAALTPSFGQLGGGGSNFQFNVTLAAGEGIGLFFLGGLNTTAQEGLNSVVQYDEFSEIQQAGLTSNLSGDDIGRIRNFNTNVSVTAAPEPGTVALVAMGLMGTAGMVVRRRK